MATCSMFGLITLITLSAWTTSGQFWHDSEKNVSKRYVPSRARIGLDGVVGELGGVAADVQEGEHQGGELVAERDAGEANADVGAGALDGERGPAGVVAVAADGDLVGECGDLVEQFGEIGGLLRVVERGDEFDRVHHVREVRLQLGGERGIEHVETPSEGCAGQR